MKPPVPAVAMSVVTMPLAKPRVPLFKLIVPDPPGAVTMFPPALNVPPPVTLMVPVVPTHAQNGVLPNGQRASDAHRAIARRGGAVVADHQVVGCFRAGDRSCESSARKRVIVD